MNHNWAWVFTTISICFTLNSQAESEKALTVDSVIKIFAEWRQDPKSYTAPLIPLAQLAVASKNEEIRNVILSELKSTALDVRQPAKKREVATDFALGVMGGLQRGVRNATQEASDFTLSLLQDSEPGVRQSAANRVLREFETSFDQKQIKQIANKLLDVASGEKERLSFKYQVEALSKWSPDKALLMILMRDKESPTTAEEKRFQEELTGLIGSVFVRAQDENLKQSARDVLKIKLNSNDKNESRSARNSFYDLIRSEKVKSDDVIPVIQELNRQVNAAEAQRDFVWMLNQLNLEQGSRILSEVGAKLSLQDQEKLINILLDQLGVNESQFTREKAYNGLLSLISSKSEWNKLREELSCHDVSYSRSTGDTARAIGGLLAFLGTAGDLRETNRALEPSRYQAREVVGISQRKSAVLKNVVHEIIGARQIASNNLAADLGSESCHSDKAAEASRTDIVNSEKETPPAVRGGNVKNENATSASGG